MPFLNPEGQDFTEEELQQLMALGIIPDQQNLLKDQMRLAERLRYDNNPEMRGNGRVQTAANPLEFLVAGIQGHKAGKELEALKKRQDELLQQQVAGRKTFYKGLRRPPMDEGLGPMPPINQEEYL